MVKPGNSVNQNSTSAGLWTWDGTSAAGTTNLTFTEDSGTASLSSFGLTIAGGNLITTAGSGHTVTISYSGGALITSTSDFPLTSNTPESSSGVFLNGGIWIIEVNSIYTYNSGTPVCTILETTTNTTPSTRGTVPNNGGEAIGSPTATCGISINFTTTFSGTGTLYPVMYAVFSGGNVDAEYTITAIKVG